MKTQTENPDAETIRAKVREGYGKIAVGEGSCCGATPNCCGSAPAASEMLAQQIGYSSAELAALPEGANMGLSCGNPTALAALQAGETMLDLGSGGGFDVFIAGRNVGPAGRAIGVDMTADMIAKARKNIATYRERSGFDNVEFRLGEIEHLPVADASVDVVISNCVINLSPDKPQVWREIARVLQPGGRVAVSDLALLQALPPEVSGMVEALVGCIAGAVTVAETERMATEAGLVDIVLKPKSGYIDSMVDWQDPLYRKIVASLPAGSKASDYITSLEITARKPAPVAASGVNLKLAARLTGSDRPEGETVPQKVGVKMKNEQKTRKGFFGILRESFSKTGGCCCGPGETCGGPTKERAKAQTKETQASKAASKPAQK